MTDLSSWATMEADWIADGRHGRGTLDHAKLSDLIMFALLAAYQRGERETLERAATLIEQHCIGYGNTNVLRPRLDGDKNGIEYATAIRALNTQEPT